MRCLMELSGGVCTVKPQLGLGRNAERKCVITALTSVRA